MNESIFWLSFWSILATTTIIISAILVYSNHLTDKRDIEYASKGLQPYTVSTCKKYDIRTEWHEAGWKPTTQQ